MGSSTLFSPISKIMSSRIKCEVDLKVDTGTLNLEGMLFHHKITLFYLANSFDVPLNSENLHNIIFSNRIETECIISTALKGKLSYKTMFKYALKRKINNSVRMCIQMQQYTS